MDQFDIGLAVPEPEPHFFLPAEVIENLKRIKLLAKRHPINVLVAGKQGCGKSTLVRQFAARNNRPLATFQIAIQTPGCVIHLEEINRPEHPKALNMLFSVLSEDRTVWTDELGLLNVANDVVFFATLNEGEEFVGTEMLDAAMRDRFYVTVLDYLPLDIETKVLNLKGGVDEAEALTIVNVANKLRNNAQEPIVVSTRHTLMIAEMVAVGALVKDAFINSLQVSRDLIESVLLSLHVELGLKETEPAKGYQVY
jgi:nitric oxide reductase NorQ protein